ncbi:MAG TPA: anthranilate synthase component I [Candidatus Micrarchaeia archaeon]|nr:anthranilate synthase component I [Candidatus Micrarchaeia archaeon]
MAALPTPRPSLEEVRVLARDHDLIPVVVELLADCDTPVSALLRLGAEPPAFLLESVEGGERWARYSVLGRDFVQTLSFRDGVCRHTVRGQTTELPYDDPLAVVDRLIGDRVVAAVAGLPPRFHGGAIGYLAYEASRWYERLPPPRQDRLLVPDAWFGIAETLLVFDHLAQRLLLVTHVDTRQHRKVENGYRLAVSRLEQLHRRLQRPRPPGLASVAASRGAPLPATPNWSRADFLAAVAEAKAHILAGDIFQVQIGRRFSVPLRCPPFDLYRALRHINPSPYMFHLALPDLHVIGASPEPLVRVEDRLATYRPIAGTRRRGDTPERDLALEAELAASEKERAEHVMLVDLGRNDLGRVAVAGSVRVTDLMVVERYSHVMHLVSQVEAQLPPGVSALRVLRECFPAGTVTGAPKIRAMELIAELEPEARGVYAGTVGHVAFGGRALDFAIVIRTIVVKDGVAYAQASAGIVADSDPDQEALEIDNKVSAQLRAVAMANAGLQPGP